MHSPLLSLRRKILGEKLQEHTANQKPLELIVKMPAAKREKLATEIARIGRITHIFESIPYLSFLCDAKEATQLVNTFYQKEKNRAYELLTAHLSAIDVSTTVSLPPLERAETLAEPWNLAAIGTYQAQRIAQGDGISVAIVDTGVDYTHPEISQCFGAQKGYDFVRNIPDPKDFNGHGTHVAGITAGKTYGVAYGARLYAVRVLDRNGSGSEADTIAGLDWAAQHSIDVINMSLGSPYASSALEEMCSYLAQNGTLIAAAAGNEGYGANYPAAFGEPVIAVAATDAKNQHAPFSNIYPTNDISAPGVDITSSYPGGYATLSGTSMATPHVSGSLALALSALKKTADIETLMEKTAQPLGKSRDTFGAGLVRADLLARAASQASLADLITAKSEKNIKKFGNEMIAVLKELWE